MRKQVLKTSKRVYPKIILFKLTDVCYAYSRHLDTTSNDTAQLFFKMTEDYIRVNVVWFELRHRVTWSLIWIRMVGTQIFYPKYFPLSVLRRKI